MISRELADGSGARGALIGNDETFSVMINEEDHVRLQVMHSGLALETAWNRINELDDWLESKANYAFHERLGYLTACPTNVGTGMRVSVLLHLPALVMAKQIDKVFRSLQKISLAVRGLYGEGSQATGDFYQISNQITLGRTESELIKQVTDVVPVIIDYERQARGFLMKEGHKDVHDRVSRAFGLLCTAQTITSEETMQLLSSVRLGVNMGLISDVEIPTINKLFLQTQPAHLQKLSGVEMTAGDGNTERAVYLQRHLRKQDSQAGQN
jgi:protein arginine kinase